MEAERKRFHRIMEVERKRFHRIMEVERKSSLHSEDEVARPLIMD